MDVKPPFVVEDRSIIAVAHLALLGVKPVEDGTLGILIIIPYKRWYE